MEKNKTEVELASFLEELQKLNFVYEEPKNMKPIIKRSLSSRYTFNTIKSDYIETDLDRILESMMDENFEVGYFSYTPKISLSENIFSRAKALRLFPYEDFFYLLLENPFILNLKFDTYEKFYSLNKKINIHFLGAGGVNSNILYLWVLSWKFFLERFSLNPLNNIEIYIYDYDKYEFSNIFRIIPHIILDQRKVESLSSKLEEANVFKVIPKKMKITYRILDRILKEDFNIFIGQVDVRNRVDFYSELAKRKINFLEISSFENFIYFTINPFIEEDLTLVIETYGILDPFCFMSSFFFSWKEIDKFLLKSIEKYLPNNISKTYNTKNYFFHLEKTLKKLH